MDLRIVVEDGRHRLRGESPITDLANSYLDHLASRQFSPATVRGYSFDLLNFSHFAAERASRRRMQCRATSSTGWTGSQSAGEAPRTSGPPRVAAAGAGLVEIHQSHTQAWRTANWHMAVMVTVTVLVIVDIAVSLGDWGVGSTRPLPLVLSLLVAALVPYGAIYGGARGTSTGSKSRPLVATPLGTRRRST